MIKIYNKEIRNIFILDVINHVTPIFKEWSYGLQELGYETFYFPLEKHSINSCHSDKVNPDLFLIHKNIQPHDVEPLREFKKRYPECIIVALFDYGFRAYKDLVGIIDFYVTLQMNSVFMHDQTEKAGFAMYDILLAGNTRFYKALDIEKKYDICWIGYLEHGYRGEDRFLYPLLDNPSYKCFLGGLKYKKYMHGHIPYEEIGPIRCQTKININFHVPYQKPDQGIDDNQISINQTVFNTPLTGSFQLCDHSYVSELFEETIPIGDENNWLDMIDKYLKDDKERERLARLSMEVALRRHTWKARMQEFEVLMCKHFKEA